MCNKLSGFALLSKIKMRNMNDKNKKFSVYCLTFPNGKRYVGQTGRLVEDRWRNGYGYKDNPVLFSDILLYGWDNINKNVLCVCCNRKEALLAEKRYIDEFCSLEPNGYNRENKESLPRVNFVSNGTSNEKVTLNLGAWKDFKPTEGMKMKVFIHCIMVSVRSNPLDEFDGNVFKVQRAVNSVMKELEEINKERESDGKDKKNVSEASIRMSISRLAKDGFIIPTDVRGEYYINPKYGIKGSIRQNTYCKLTLASETGKKVLTKRENTDIGK